MPHFTSLDAFEPTRSTLHAYAHAVGVVPRAHAIPHPKWWHISQKVVVDGLQTDTIPLPSGDILSLKLNLISHQVEILTSQGSQDSQSMAAGLTGTEMGSWIINTVNQYGLSADYARAKFENDEKRPYDPTQAANFFKNLTLIDTLFKQHRAKLPGDVGPVQLWSHGFDLAFEWFGSRQVTFDEDGETESSPSQLNLGFYPGEPAYFYSNPFPFEAEKLLNHPLPAGAHWHTEGWNGSKLPYDALVDDPDGPDRVLAYAREIFKAASPTLMVEED